MLNRSASLAMSTSILEALPDKLDIKRHSPSIFYLCSLSYLICFRAPIENDGLDGITNFHIVFGVFLLGCFIGLVALCLGSEVDPGQYVKLYHECEDGIEKSVTDWDHEACRVMTKGDHEAPIFLSHPHTNNGLFFSLITKYRISYWKKTP